VRLILDQLANLEFAANGPVGDGAVVTRLAE
jgi:hypothetical protein